MLAHTKIFCIRPRKLHAYGYTQIILDIVLIFPLFFSLVFSLSSLLFVTLAPSLRQSSEESDREREGQGERERERERSVLSTGNKTSWHPPTPALFSRFHVPHLPLSAQRYFYTVVPLIAVFCYSCPLTNLIFPASDYLEIDNQCYHAALALPEGSK